MPTRLQVDAALRAERLRRLLADDLRRLREDAGLSRAVVARHAGVHPSAITRIEGGDLQPTIETYVRLAAALGADFAARLYPNAGPTLRDRHQVRIGEIVLGCRHTRWRASPEVRVRRPASGWVDLVLDDPRAATLVASELESELRRIEQLLRWSAEKANSLPSSDAWAGWAADGTPRVSRLLVVRWTRANREAAAAARRQLRAAYPADPIDALESLTGTAAWPGDALLWARIDGDHHELVARP